MKGLSEKAAKSVERLIKNKFDALSLNILGFLPKPSKEKRILFTTNQDNLISLFLQALGTKNPNGIEEQALKLLLMIASGYIDALRDRTTSSSLHMLNSYFVDRNLKKQPTKVSAINEIIESNMDKAKHHFKLIANAETNKAANTGTAMQISKIAEEKGEEDPTVFFIVTDDERTGFYEYILHTLPDRVTPRLWKLSEVTSDYYKNGDQYPSMCGLHVNCRCKLTYLSSGWSFNEKGNVKYHSPDYDAFKVQRDKYGLPKVPPRPKKKNGEWVYSKQ